MLEDGPQEEHPVTSTINENVEYAHITLSSPFHSFFLLIKGWNFSFASAFRSYADFRFTCSIDLNWVPFKAHLIFGKRKKSHGLNQECTLRVRASECLWQLDNTTKTIRYRYVCCPFRRYTTFFPQLQPFLTNSLSQCCQNFQIVSLIYSLNLWNPFSHHDAVDARKMITIALNFDFDILAFYKLLFHSLFKVEFDIDHYVLGEHRER